MKTANKQNRKRHKEKEKTEELDNDRRGSKIHKEAKRGKKEAKRGKKRQKEADKATYRLTQRREADKEREAWKSYNIYGQFLSSSQ